MIRETLSAVHLQSKLQVLRGSPSPVVLLFTATRKEDGSRWCPDCEESDPVLQEAMQHAPAAVQLIEVELSREEWKVDPGAGHFLRKEPYNVSGIPTMMLWNPDENKCMKKFNEADLLQLENVSEFFRSMGLKASS
mmetsp:Transcript_6254/g.10083  ORF Transcript_6254/g.10083 Transcript_6254/m.10083 type:complete len:136 (+) Transcript_6254:246-653(+)|eukprot:CAMPEP_0171496706 /NCGR_PEP_ID=MMETSP0958-20121227/6857_1 /TAXON_ID=87120 /ORGANISM="Aurantiochytrium limacinum, Strain ATCCMYA-1381" /LENGTH=135 /DNA_ID=CAMNT_0012030851 /DNA_START=44 /DNA_END=451 /DNA_ORIENTATION=+